MGSTARAAVVLATLLFLLWLVVLLPPSLRQSATFLLVFWAILIPLAYCALGEATPPVNPLLELPRVPVGFHWEPRPARHPKRESQLHDSGRVSRDIWKFLRRNGYSSVTPSDSGALVESPRGRRVLVKVYNDTAGVLACQDTMRDMIRSGVKDAILFAPKGSTRGARRFVRAIRSKRRLRIHIWQRLDHPLADIRMRGNA